MKNVKRVGVDLSPEHYELVAKAAEAEGSNPTVFVRSSAIKAARTTLAERGSEDG